MNFKTEFVKGPFRGNCTFIYCFKIIYCINYATLVHIDPDRSEIASIFKAGPTSKCRSVLAYDFT